MLPAVAATAITTMRKNESAEFMMPNNQVKARRQASP